MGASSGAVGGDGESFSSRGGPGAVSGRQDTITSRKQTPLSQSQISSLTGGGGGDIGSNDRSKKGFESFYSGPGQSPAVNGQDTIISRKQTALSPNANLAAQSTGPDSITSRKISNVTGGTVNGVGGGGQLDGTTLKLSPFGLTIVPSTSQLPNPQVAAQDPQDRTGGGQPSDIGSQKPRTSAAPLVPQQQTEDQEPTLIDKAPTERTPRRQLNLSLAEVTRKTLLGA